MALGGEERVKTFIVVIHGWFTGSNGFNIHEIHSDTRESAEKEAAHICYQRDSTFDKCAYQVIEIGDRQIVKPRKLTIRERITGRLSPCNADLEGVKNG